MISFITSVYEGEKYLDRFLLSMTYVEEIKKSEIILIVNKTKTYKQDMKIINKFINKLPLKIISCAPESIYCSWNRGIKKSKNNLVANANLDDIIYPNYIKTMTKLTKKYKKTSLFCGWDHLILDEKELYIDSRKIKNTYKETYNRNFLFGKVGFINLLDTLQRCYLGCHPVWRKGLHEKHGYFSSEYGASGDYEFWTRCIANGERAYCTSEIIGGYFHNPNGLSTKKEDRMLSIEYDRQIKKIYGGLD
jgi:hypothetical protein